MGPFDSSLMAKAIKSNIGLISKRTVPADTISNVRFKNDVFALMALMLCSKSTVGLVQLRAVLVG